MEKIIAWIALLAIFAIPLASMVPRMLRKRRKSKTTAQTVQEKRKVQTSHEKHLPGSPLIDPEPTKNMLVLGNLVRGSKTFGKIQKNTMLSNKELDSILENLEESEMVEVHQKKSLLGGIKIELCPTEKGIKEYYSYIE